MSENRIRKTDTVQPASPGGAGVRVGTDGNFYVNPDGTERTVGPLVFTITGITSASASGYYGVAPVNMEFVSAQHAVTVNGGSGAQYEVVKGAAGTAVASGTVISAVGALTGLTANTPVTVAANATQATRRVAAGQQFGLKIGGTLTSLAGGVVTLRFKQY